MIVNNTSLPGDIVGEIVVGALVGLKTKKEVIQYYLLVKLCI